MFTALAPDGVLSKTQSEPMQVERATRRSRSTAGERILTIEQVRMRADERRLAQVLKAHLELVWRVLRRSGLSERDVDEAAQDVFWILSRRFAEVPERAEKSFLVSTALRVASDRRRALARHPEVELDPELASSDPPADELVALRRARALLDEALDGLSAEQRAVFILVEMEEMTAPEVAEALTIPVGTVASRLRTARQSFDAAIRRLRLRERGTRS